MNATIKQSPTNTESIYSTWLIVPVANYSDGLTDWQVYEDEGRERGVLMYRKTLSEVHQDIDEREDEVHNQLVIKAYKACDYQFVNDAVVVTDRVMALDKLTNEQLLNIINK
jgi:hypothetical protein